MTKLEITKLIKKSESETFEKKPSLSDIGRITEVVCSLANHKGGQVLIGVSDNGRVVGIDIGKNTIERLTDIIVDNTEPKVYPEISTLKSGKNNLILIVVKPSEQKPHTAYGRPFKRVGKNTKLMAQSEYKRLLLEQSKDKFQFDAMECPGAAFADIDAKKVKEFLMRAKEERRLKINPNINVKEALIKLKLLKNNQLTNAAILMFGKEPQEFVLQSEVRCAKFKGTLAVKPFIDMKVIEGTMDEQIDLVEKFIMNNIKKSAWVVPGQMKREEKWEYPLGALREAVINAICHRDYSSTSNVQVRILDDRIEIWNPGNLPEGWTVETLKKKHESKPKNPLIAKLFFMIKNIERWGTGIDDMIRETVGHGLPEPEFEDTKTSIIVTFRKYTLSGDDLIGLNERQKKAIHYLVRHGKITSKKYIILTDVGERTARNDLSLMVNMGLLQKKGKTQGVYYIIRQSFGNIRQGKDEK